MLTYEEREALIRNTAKDLQKKIEEIRVTCITEADFQQSIKTLLEKFCQEVGVNPLSHSEYTLATGRADAVFNRLVIEYERPGVYRMPRHFRVLPFRHN